MKFALKLLSLAVIIGFASCGSDNLVNPCPSGKLPIADTVYQFNDEWYSPPTDFMIFAKSEVTLAKGNFAAFDITGPKNLVGRLQTYQQGDTFYLDYDLCIFKFSPFKNKVFAPVINEVSIYDSSLCAFDPEFTQQNLVLNTNDRTSGIITGVFENLEVNNTSENPLTIEGQHDLLLLSHSGRGEMDILNASIKTANINHNSSANIYISAVETLSVNINSAGNIYYEGDPVLDVNQNGTGQALKL